MNSVRVAPQWRFSPTRLGVRSPLHALLPLLAVLALLSLSQRVGAQPSPATVGEWSAVMPWPIVGIHSHLLPNGKVLVWPRDGGVGAKVWDPAADKFTDVPLPATNLFCSGHSFLADGRLHVTGGHIEDGVGMVHTNLFDWRTNTWTRVGDMNAGRWYPTNCTLPNGDALVVSGNIDNNVGGNPLPQVWSAKSGWRDLTDAQMYLPLYPYLHLAPNGKVFMSGPGQTSWYLDTAGKGQWSPVADSHEGFRDYGGSVMYDSGKVLVLGGHDPPVSSAEVIDLNNPTPAWRLVGNMAFTRRQCNATLLADGTVLVTGGTSGGGFNNPEGSVFAAEIWNPATEQFTTVASAAERRLYHSTAILLPDGRVLSAGGGQPAGGGIDTDHYTAEFYSPPYLFNGARPTITTAPTRVTWGQNFAVTTPDAAAIQKVLWISLSSVTHSDNMNQRINRLAFTKASGKLNVAAPANSKLCVPGYYMLFILNGKGVPSVAKMVRIDGAPPTTVPAAPTNLTAKTSSGTTVRLTWVDASDNEDSFEAFRFANGGWKKIKVTGPNERTCLETGLTPNTEYRYVVRAVNGKGPSALSNEASVRTLGPPVDGTGIGLLGEYFNWGSGEGAVLTRTDPTVDFDWHEGSPDMAVDEDFFSVRWTGKVLARYTETYTFHTVSDDGVRLWVNNKLIIDNWTDHAPTTNTGVIPLKANVKYDIRMEYYERGGGATATLSWSSDSQVKEYIPQSQLYSTEVDPPTNGLNGAYYDNADLTQIRLRRTDRALNFNWGDGAPDHRLSPDTFSARWTGYLIPAYSETYTFSTVSDDGVRVWVNGKQIINNWTTHPRREDHGTIALEGGRKCAIKVEYFNNRRGAELALDWASPSQAREIVPHSRLFRH